MVKESERLDRARERPRVVHVIVAGDIGGAERLLVDLASRPSESGADHSVALMTPNPKLRQMLTAAGLRILDRGPVRENPLAYLWRSFGPADLNWLVDKARQERATVVHVHTFASHVLGVRAAIRLGLPVVRTEHHVVHYTDRSCSPFTRWALKRTDAVVAISEYVAAFVRETAPYAAPKLSVVRNGVDATYFHPIPESTPHVDRPFTFSVVCRLERWKQVDLILEAMASVPDVHVAIAGDGSEREKLELLARRLNVTHRVQFHGYKADPRPILAACDASINSSKDEPLGLSVLEALAVSRPVVAFAGGGIPEIVQDEATGWLVRERSVHALADRLRAASRSRERARTMGQEGRRFIERGCRIEDMCKGYASVYAALTAEKPAFALQM